MTRGRHRAATHPGGRLVAAAVALSVPVTGGLIAPPATAAPSDIVAVSTSTRAADAQQLLEQINAHRASLGLAPVRYSATLSGIAQSQSDRLVVDEVIDHTTDFMTDPRAAGWSAVGEIHAISWRVSVVDLVNWWKSSPAHNKVMTDPKMQVIGIGLTYVDGSLTGDGSGWRLVGTVNSYGYPEGKGPTDVSNTVSGTTAAPAPAPSTSPSPNPSAHSPSPSTSAPAPVDPVTVAPFSDVPSAHPFAEEITWMRTSGISTGWTGAEGTRLYRPSWNVTRGQMAAFLYRLAGSPDYTPPSVSSFADVRTTQDFYKEISWLVDSGVSNGWTRTDGTRVFKPGQEISRDQMAAFLYRLAGSPTYTAPEASAFTDVRTTQVFYKEMAWMHGSGIANGWSDGTYRPGTSVGRDVMAAFLHRFHQLR